MKRVCPMEQTLFIFRGYLYQIKPPQQLPVQQRDVQ